MTRTATVGPITTITRTLVAREKARIWIMFHGQQLMLKYELVFYSVLLKHSRVSYTLASVGRALAGLNTMVCVTTL
jgi:hypothetical protein